MFPVSSKHYSISPTRSQPTKPFWTHSQNPRVEREVTHILQVIKHQITSFYQRNDYLCVAVTGGYGRGEGGVQYLGGQPRPSNNIDLLWLLPEGKDADALKARFEQQIAAPVRARYAIDIDCYFIGRQHLKRLPCLVMLYDLKNGHRILCGDADVLSQSIEYQRSDILPSDMRNLMVNRATLLLLNQWLLSQFSQQNTQDQRLPEALYTRVIKHTVKAIVGYGDALLFSQGDYHWSYAEKERLMGVLISLPVALRRQYSQAIRYRFEPQSSDLDIPEPYVAPLMNWQDELLAQFAPWHLAYENWRMQSHDSGWADYLERSLRYAMGAENQYRGVILRKTKHFVRNFTLFSKLPWRSHLGLIMSEPASVLSALFPYIAYKLDIPEGVYEQLQVSTQSSFETVRERFLHCWGAHLDPALLGKMTDWQVHTT